VGSEMCIRDSQNTTPSVTAVATKAKSAGIPIVEITETPSPGNLLFQDWQTQQLKDLLKALGG